MNSISFKSTIKPVSPNKFKEIIRPYNKGQYVDYPWTVKESVLSNSAYTRGVYDCTVCGITDGIKVLLMHICPTIEFMSTKKIENYLKDKFNLNNPNLQGFIMGGKARSEAGISYEQFDNFKDVLDKLKIPYTSLKGSGHTNDVAYDSTKDTWFISTPFAEDEEIQKAYSSKNFIENIFDEVHISDKDEISW